MSSSGGSLPPFGSRPALSSRATPVFNGLKTGETATGRDPNEGKTTTALMAKQQCKSLIGNVRDCENLLKKIIRWCKCEMKKTFWNLNESKWSCHFEVSFCTKVLFHFTTNWINKMWLRLSFDPLSTNSEKALSYQGKNAINPCKWEHKINTTRGEMYKV